MATPSGNTSKNNPAAGSIRPRARCTRRCKRLADEELIAPADGPGDADVRRKYFVLTRQGRRVAAAEAERLHNLVRAARERKLFPQRT